MLEEAYASESNDPYIIDSIGWAYYLIDNFVKAEQFLKRAVKKSKVTKSVTLHTLRHSFATQLLEDGIGIAHIQKLLGHSNMSTTLIYTHIAVRTLEKIKSPFDD